MSSVGNKNPYLVIGSVNIDGPMYAFDLDGTLIQTRGKTVFPVDSHDWKWRYRWMLDVLSHLGNIVIITNQKATKKNPIEMRTEMIQSIDTKLKRRGVQATWLVSCGEGWYRKPCTGLFELLNGVKLEESFYVGDAAGRETDHSCCDRKFAHNIGVKFFTMEYLINGHKEKFSWGFIPQPYPNSNVDQLSLLQTKHSRPILVIMVGPPASLKTETAKSFHKPIIISQDYLKTERKCLRILKETIVNEIHKATNDASTIVIDNTNPTVGGRAKYITIAQENSLQVYCVVMQVDRNMAKHLSLYREGQIGKHIPTIAYNVFYKRYEEPTISEGFEDIYNIIPDIKQDICEKFYI